jgi:hypothetical protein
MQCAGWAHPQFGFVVCLEAPLQLLRSHYRTKESGATCNDQFRRLSPHRQQSFDPTRRDVDAHHHFGWANPGTGSLTRDCAQRKYPAGRPKQATAPRDRGTRKVPHLETSCFTAKVSRSFPKQSRIRFLFSLARFPTTRCGSEPSSGMRGVTYSNWNVSRRKSNGLSVPAPCGLSRFFRKQRR